MEQGEVLAPQSEIQIIASKINTGLAAFETRKAELTQLKEDAAGLTIESIEDKAAIQKVATWRKKLKAARVEIQKEGKAMRDPLTKISKSISEKEYELIDIISPTEKDLQSKEDWVAAENLKIEQAEASRKQALLQDRIDRLAEYGYAIDITFLTALDDEQYEKVLDNARIEFEKEEAKKADEAKLEQERQAQIQKDQEELKALKAKQAEADRIIKERQDELDRQAEQLKQQQAAERKRIIQQRVYRLNNTHFDGQEVIWKHDKSVLLSGLDAIVDPTEDEFTAFCVTHNTEHERVLHEQFLVEEKKREQKIEEAKIEATAVARLGMLRKLGLTYPNGDLGNLTEPEWDEMYSHRKSEYDAAEKKKADDRDFEQKKLDDQKKQQELAAQGDKAVWADFISKLKALPVPSMNSSQYRRMATATRGKLIEIYAIKP